MVVPVATQRQVCTAPVVQKTVEIPQLQFLDLVVVPVLCNDKFWYRQCRKKWNCRRCSSCGVVDVPSIMQLLFQQSKSYVSRAIQFDKVPDIPVVPQKGDSTVQSFSVNQRVDCSRVFFFFANLAFLTFISAVVKS